MNSIKVRILYGLLGVLTVFCLALSGQVGGQVSSGAGGGGAGDTCGTGGLATLSNLQNATAGSDPSWITGDEDEPSTPATTQSRSTYTISGGRMQ